jgi:hypothetical protein
MAPGFTAVAGWATKAARRLCTAPGLANGRPGASFSASASASRARAIWPWRAASSACTKWALALFGMQHQHLLDHGLRLLQTASLRRVIDLLQGGFGLRHRAQASAQGRTQQDRHGQPPGQTLHQGSIHHGLRLLQGCRYRLEMVPRGQKTSARQGRIVRTAGNNSQFNSNK